MTESTSLADELTQIVVSLARHLWSVHRDDPAGPRLLMPSKRDNSIRISEQESKILFCQLLEATHWFYSVETPTAKTYVQSGRKPRSAWNDISLYENRNTQSRIVNIELKAHNPKEEDIRKDLEKLVREGVDGVWFHTLRTVNKRTIESLFNKFRSAFRGIETYLQGQVHFIIFAFCILETRSCFVASLELDGTPKKIFSRIDEMFDAEGLLGGSIGRWRVYGNGNEDGQPHSSHRTLAIPFSGMPYSRKE